MKVVDCNDSGFILHDQSFISWDDIEVVGKCEYPGRDLPWEFFYIRRRSTRKNERVPTLKRFSFFRNDEKDTRERLLRIKLFEKAQTISQVQFVKKITHFGKESAWCVENDITCDHRACTPAAQQIRREYQRNFRIIITVLIVGFLIFILLESVLGK